MRPLFTSLPGQHAGRLGALLCALAVHGAASAGAAETIDTLRQQGYTVRSVTPVFSQLVMMSFPAGFQAAFEETRGGNYIHEAVLNGENVNNWTQMVTLSGAKEQALNPNITPEKLVNQIAGGFKQACPTSFSAALLVRGQLAGFDAFTAVISCGSSATPVGKASETTMFTAIKGERDYYTIQWALRGAPSATPLPIDTQQWLARFRQLTPIKLCPIVPGEAAPYPSCVQ